MKRIPHPCVEDRVGMSRRSGNRVPEPRFGISPGRISLHIDAIPQMFNGCALSPTGIGPGATPMRRAQRFAYHHQREDAERSKNSGS
jgi:hypothetical protein